MGEIGILRKALLAKQKAEMINEYLADYVGFTWHVHHDQIVEWCTSLRERRGYILRFKAQAEQKIRLKLLKPVHSVLPAEVGLTLQAVSQAFEAYGKKPGKETVKAYEQALKVNELTLQANMPEILALHAQECKGCPWDGKTIFPN